MKKKVLSVLLAAAMAMSMLTGCGSKPAGNDAQSAAPSEASKETEAAAETTASAEDETLTVWCWDPNFNVYAMKQAEKAYQVDHPNFKLDIQEKVYSDIETALITAAEAGDYSTLPDIFLMQDYSFHKNATNYPGIFTALDDCGIDFSQFSMGKLFHTKIGVKLCSMAGGGVSRNLWNFFRTAPAGTGQAVTCSTSGMGLRLK